MRCHSIFVAACLGLFVGCDDSDYRVKSAQQSISQLRVAAECYYVEHGKPTPTLATLTQSFPTRTGRLTGPFLDPTFSIIDPWGHPYIYPQPTDLKAKPDIFSAGRDGVAGTSDDVRPPS